MAFCEFFQRSAVPNCNGRQLDLVLSARNGTSVSAADEGLLPVDVYHPPLAITVPAAAAPVQAGAPPAHLDPDTTAHARPDHIHLSHLRKKYNFNKADFERLYYLISLIDWSELYQLEDPGAVLKLFYDKFYEAIEECVPTKRVASMYGRRVYPVWYTSDIISEIKVKYEMHKKYKASKLRSDYEAFARCRARVKAETARAHDRYCDRVQNHLAREPRAFWDYVRSRKGNPHGGKLIKEGRVLSQLESANEFAQFFHSVYNPTPAALSVSAASAAGMPGSWAHLAPFTARDVRCALARLPSKRSVGPDGIPMYMFKDCREVLVKPLLHVFNLCIKTATFPESWKITRVVPVYKGGGGGSNASDYRPIAVLCTPAKVFEAAIHRSLYVQLNSQLSTAQHGFRPGRGTTGNLLHLMSQLVPTVDAGGQVDVAYFDFKKAFDLVDNDILLLKLANLGLTPHTLGFFASYLRDRRQYVDCSGYLSEPYFTRSGVSQGSTLGPLLFNCMINDLPIAINKSTPLLFADDLKLVHQVNTIEDHENLQEDIDNVVNWSIENKLFFNINKCSVVSFSRSRTPRQHQYHMKETPMLRVGEIKDLGVLFTADLQFRKHIVNVCRKAYRNLGFVLRQASQFKNVGALKALFEALVKSHLECNSVIWSPHEAKYKTMLERIQNKYVRFIYMKQYGVYPGYPLLYPTLFVLGMVGYFQIEVRREVALATYLFKVIRGIIENPAILAELKLIVPTGGAVRRRRLPLLAVPRARTNLLHLAPLTRALRALNAVADTIDVFSCSLKEFTKTTYMVLSV